MQRHAPDQIEHPRQRLTLGMPTIPAAPPRDPAADLERQRVRMFEQAREQGRAEGLEQARQKIEQEVEAARLSLENRHQGVLDELECERAALRELAKGVAHAVQEHADRAEELAAEVAFAAVTRLLGQGMDRSELLLAMCSEIVREFGHPAASLRVGERDYALLGSSELGVPLVLDRRLEPGQCVLESPRGQFDSGLDVRLEGLKQALLAALDSPVGAA